jgi:uncharacterized protein (TIGR00730 family)
VKRLCVFAGSRPGADPAYRQAAVDLARQLVDRELTLVYGGASVGLMGIVADAVLAAGGDVIGVIPQALMDREVAHPGLSELRVVGSMHERKALMGELSDAALALPGGLGTFEELLEWATWSMLGIHAKPCGLLNIGGYYDPLAAMLERAVSQSFLTPKYRDVVLVENEPGSLVHRLAAWAGREAEWRSSL